MTFSTANIVALLLILVSSVALIYLTRQSGMRSPIGLRRLRGFEALQRQTAKAVESGKAMHFSVGTGNLGNVSNPASLAALSSLEGLTTESNARDKPPLVTTGDGSLYVASLDVHRKTFDTANSAGGDVGTEPQFIASNSDPMSYGAGVSDIINREDLGSNLIIGRIGSELALIAEAAERKELEQIIGSDDLTALAVATPITDNLILGEELYASAAYLRGKPADIAGLQLQDILRIFIAISILVAALISLFIG